MKIILIYPDGLGKEDEEIIINWLQDWIDNPSINHPLRYCEAMVVDKEDK
jgi:uncharacterized UBP type Zn finger protein